MINGEDGVGEALRQRVWQSIEELGYRPDRAAQTLRSGRNYALCVLTALAMSEAHDMEMAPEFITLVMTGALSTCRERGYQLIFDTVPPAGDDRDALLHRLRSLRCDGVLLYPPHADKLWLLDALDELAIPYVRLAPGIQIDRSACFQIDDFEAGSRIGELFAEHGHRAVACLSGPANHIAARQRIDGFRAALAQTTDATIDEYEGDFRFNSGLALGRTILAGPDRPTAVFAANDLMAFGVLAAAAEHDLRIPEDLSIAGFDDITASRIVRPALTTVSQEVAQMARLACSQLIDTIAGQAEDPAPARKLHYQLRLRESVAAARLG